MLQTIRSKTVYERKKDVELIYNLIFQNALYSIECIRVGGSVNEDNDYCFIENITDDETDAEYGLHTLAKGKVFPVHIKDVIDDLFI